MDDIDDFPDAPGPIMGTSTAAGMSASGRPLRTAAAAAADRDWAATASGGTPRIRAPAARPPPAGTTDATTAVTTTPPIADATLNTQDGVSSTSLEGDGGAGVVVVASPQHPAIAPSPVATPAASFGLIAAAPSRGFSGASSGPAPRRTRGTPNARRTPARARSGRGALRPPRFPPLDLRAPTPWTRPAADPDGAGVDEVADASDDRNDSLPDLEYEPWEQVTTGNHLVDGEREPLIDITEPDLRAPAPGRARLNAGALVLSTGRPLSVPPQHAPVPAARRNPTLSLPPSTDGLMHNCVQDFQISARLGLLRASRAGAALNFNISCAPSALELLGVPPAAARIFFLQPAS